MSIRTALPVAALFATLIATACRARATFRRVLETGYWPAFGHIAAEAELRELEAPEDPAPMPSAKPLKTTTPSTVDSLRR